MRLILLCLLLLASQVLPAADIPSHKYSHRYYAKQLRKALHKREVSKRKVRHHHAR